MDTILIETKRGWFDVPKSFDLYQFGTRRRVEVLCITDGHVAFKISTTGGKKYKRALIPAKTFIGVYCRHALPEGI